jgi:hypothetical protein
MDVCLLWVLSGRGLCDELITRPEDSYRLWCGVVCDLETSWLRRPWPTEGCRAKNKQNPRDPAIDVQHEYSPESGPTSFIRQCISEFFFPGLISAPPIIRFPSYTNLLCYPSVLYLQHMFSFINLRRPTYPDSIYVISCVLKLFHPTCVRINNTLTRGSTSLANCVLVWQ